MFSTSLLRPPRTFDYGVELRIFRTPASRIAFFLLLLALLILPFVATRFWLTVVNLALIASIGAIGLNVVSGSAGQISLGHAFFIGIGAYTSAGLTDLGLPFPVALLGAGLMSAIASSLVGPFTLRLRGLYMAFATVALVFIGVHVFVNFSVVTGGSAGRSIPSPVIGGTPLSSASEVFGQTWTGDQKWYFILLPLTAIVALAIRNLQRGSWGRAFNAVRDHDLAAWVSGINLPRTKLYAFVLSAFLGGIAGSLLGSYTGFVNPERFDLLLSVDYLAMIIIGGMGSVMGAILGALFIIALPRVVDQIAPNLPFVTHGLATDTGLTPDLFSLVLYGLLIMGFLMFEPAGLAGIWQRIRHYFVAWPFRY